jgi:hypothetical protein
VPQPHRRSTWPRAAGSGNLLVVVHLPARAGPADRTIPAANTSSTSKLAVLRGVPVDDAETSKYKQARRSIPDSFANLAISIFFFFNFRALSDVAAGVLC